MGAKSHVKHAALNNELSIIIPETFSRSLFWGLKKDDMQKYSEDPNILQVFARVINEKGKFERFQSTVNILANYRASFSEEESFTVDDIRMNNRNIKCESKPYYPSGFRLGSFCI